MTTRWYLSREGTGISLTVEEVGGDRRGVRWTWGDAGWFTRRAAQVALPELRSELARRIAETTRPVRTFDPSEAAVQWTKI